MLLGLSREEVNDWSNSLHTYQKAKRTKRPFGSMQPKVEFKSVSDVISKQMRFNPVLQSFRDAHEQSKTIEHEEIQKVSDQIKHLKNNYKYTADYDIINFSQSITLPPSQRAQSLAHQNRKKEHKDPSYQNYDIINGKQYQPAYLEKVGYLPVKYHERQIHPEESRVYNIISGRYDENHEEKSSMQEAQSRQEALSKSQRLRGYDTINSQYYNPQLEENSERKRKKQELHVAQKHKERLPPSYINRESYVQGEIKDLPEVVKTLDQQKELAKQRYKLRYLVDQEYRMRNEYLTQKKERETRNRVHNGRVLEEKGKEFNIINSQVYENSRAEQLFGKEVPVSPYQLRPIHPSPIKQQGFSQFSL